MSRVLPVFAGLIIFVAPMSFAADPQEESAVSKDLKEFKVVVENISDYIIGIALLPKRDGCPFIAEENRLASKACDWLWANYYGEIKWLNPNEKIELSYPVNAMQDKVFAFYRWSLEDTKANAMEVGKQAALLAGSAITGGIKEIATKGFSIAKQFYSDECLLPKNPGCRLNLDEMKSLQLDDSCGWIFIKNAYSENEKATNKAIAFEIIKIDLKLDNTQESKSNNNNNSDAIGSL